VYGGPTYSQSTGGYRVDSVDESGNSTDPPAIGASYPAFYGTVNDAGVAIGNVLRVDSPLTTTPQSAFASVARWSATSPSTFLSPPSANQAIFVRAINDAGIAIGGTDTSYTCQISTTGASASSHNGLTAARWSSAGVISVLSNLGANSGLGTMGRSINSQGTSICNSGPLNSQITRAGRWDANSTGATELTTPNNGTYSGGIALSINDSGVVAGQFYPSFSSRQAMVWGAGQAAGTPLVDLGHPSGAFFDSGAIDINSAGMTVGYARVFNSGGASQGLRPAVWDSSGLITQLGDWGTAHGFSTATAYALAINDSGVIAGNDTTSSGHALRWNSGSTAPVVLAAVPSGSPSTTAFAINSQGLIVGSSQISTVASHAVYWNQDGSVVDLNSLIDPASGWTLSIASAISDTGWILGVGKFDPDLGGPQVAYDRLYILQVPVPSTVAGDFDGDGVLTQTDLTDLLQAITDQTAWETAHGLGNDRMRLMGDVSGDGVFDNADAQALIYKLINLSAGPSPVPEPNTIALATVGFVILAAGRCHRRSG
jgi:probable HAF family extracellular repeat protein